jgi:hypothetical protein
VEEVVQVGKAIWVEAIDTKEECGQKELGLQPGGASGMRGWAPNDRLV